MSLLSPIPKTTTYAGSPAYPKDINGPIASAGFGSPRDITVYNGIYYVLCGSATVRKIQGGQVTTLPLPSTSGTINEIVATEFGLFAVFLSPTNTIWKYTYSTNTWSLYAGSTVNSTASVVNGPVSEARFLDPRSLSYGVNHLGEKCLYVADRSSHLIRKINLVTNVVSNVAGTPKVRGRVNTPFASARFDSPLQVYVYTETKLLVVDSVSIRIVDTLYNTIQDLNIASLTSMYPFSTIKVIGVLTGTIILSTNSGTMIFAISQTAVNRGNINLVDLTRVSGTGTRGYLNTNTPDSLYGSVQRALSISSSQFLLTDTINHSIRLLDTINGTWKVGDDYPNQGTNIPNTVPTLRPFTTIRGTLNDTSDIDCFYFTDYQPYTNYTLSVSSYLPGFVFSAQTLKNVTITTGTASNNIIQRSNTVDPIRICVQNINRISGPWAMTATGLLPTPTSTAVPLPTPTRTRAATPTPTSTPTRTKLPQATPTGTPKPTITPTRTRIPVTQAINTTLNIVEANDNKTIFVPQGVTTIQLHSNPNSGFDVRLVGIEKGQYVTLRAGGSGAGVVIDSDNSSNVGSSIRLPLPINLVVVGGNMWLADSDALTTPTPTPTNTVTPTLPANPNLPSVATRYLVTYRRRFLPSGASNFLEFMPVSYIASGGNLNPKGTNRVVNVRYGQTLEICSLIVPRSSYPVSSTTLEIIPVGLCVPPQVTPTGTPLPTPTATRNQTSSLSGTTCHEWHVSYNVLAKLNMSLNLQPIPIINVFYKDCQGNNKTEPLWFGDTIEVCSSYKPELQYPWIGEPFVYMYKKNICGSFIPPTRTPTQTPSTTRTPTPTKRVSSGGLDIVEMEFDLPVFPSPQGLVTVGTPRTSRMDYVGDQDTFYTETSAGALYRVTVETLSSTVGSLSSTIGVQVRDIMTGNNVGVSGTNIVFEGFDLNAVFTVSTTETNIPEEGLGYTLTVTLLSAASPSATPTPTPTRTTFSVTPSATVTPTPTSTTPSTTFSVTPTPTPTRTTFSVTPSATVTPTPSTTPSTTFSVTPSATVTPTPTKTPTQTGI
jgi:hypothetical protein